MWCTLCSQNPRYDAHYTAWLRGRMHTAELDSVVWCTPQSLTLWDDAHHRVQLRSGKHIKVFLKNCDHLTPQCDAHCEFDSTLGSTQQSLTPWDDAHHGVWLRERRTPWSFVKIWISQRNQNWILRYVSLFIWGLDGLESWKNEGKESCDTLPLKQFKKCMRLIFRATSIPK